METSKENLYNDHGVFAHGQYCQANNKFVIKLQDLGQKELNKHLKKFIIR